MPDNVLIILCDEWCDEAFAEAEDKLRSCGYNRFKYMFPDFRYYSDTLYPRGSVTGFKEQYA